MGDVRSALETSLTAAIDLGTVDEEAHAAAIAAARRAADELDMVEVGARGSAALLTAFLKCCTTLGLAPNVSAQQPAVVAEGRLARLRAGSQAAALRAV